MRVAAGVDLERAGDEVGGLRQHVAVVADARDLAGLLHLDEHVFQHAALFMRPFQRLRKADFVERAVALGLELAEDAFAQRERFHAGQATREGRGRAMKVWAARSQAGTAAGRAAVLPGLV